jgi:NADH-quinone oxidoreductase subunit J
MTAELFVFYLLAAVTVASGVMVISARNPVHSVLFLILAFFNSAGLFVLIGAEFLAMILVVVYVGAVAVLFMFVVMMLDINFLRLQEGFMKFLPVGLLVGVILLAELVLVGGTYVAAGGGGGATEAPQVAAGPAVSNTQAIGNLLYTQYFYLFQTAGMILLVAIIGAITLTLRQRPVRRQDIGRQVNRLRAETVELRKVRSGGGV